MKEQKESKYCKKIYLEKNKGSIRLKGLDESEFT